MALSGPVGVAVGACQSLSEPVGAVGACQSLSGPVEEPVGAPQSIFPRGKILCGISQRHKVFFPGEKYFVSATKYFSPGKNTLQSIFPRGNFKLINTFSKVAAIESIGLVPMLIPSPRVTKCIDYGHSTWTMAIVNVLWP